MQQRSQTERTTSSVSKCPQDAKCHDQPLSPNRNHLISVSQHGAYFISICYVATHSLCSGVGHVLGEHIQPTSFDYAYYSKCPKNPQDASEALKLEAAMTILAGAKLRAVRKELT